MTMTALYQNQSIRQIESAVIQQKKVSEFDLMEKAGFAAFQSLLEKWPAAKSVTVLCGKGNNAGDGFVLARAAHEQGMQVAVYLLADQESYQGAAKEALELCVSSNINFFPFDSEITLSCDVCVDALLGTGLHGDVTGLFETAITAINASEAPVLALDVPSGLNADTGAIHGCAVHADLTHTFIALKPGLFTHKGSAYAGEVLLCELEIPSSIFETVTPCAELMDWQTMSSNFPLRQRDANKGDFGHVLIIGGDYGMGGAVRMTAEAALRVGSGLVTVATRPEHVSIVSGIRPEIMCHEVTKASDLAPLIEKASVIVIGPGLGKSEWSRELLATVLLSPKLKVLDADSLNILSETRQSQDNWILTPHPGEAARLLKTTVPLVQANRFASVDALIKQYGGVIVLKGAGTLVQTKDAIPSICPMGNPGMATAGMGDVLSGVLGGLLAQHLSLFEAAKTGVMLHAMAADCAAKAHGERGLLASDLMVHLRALVNPL